MSSLFSDSSAAWAALLIIALPMVIIGIGEVTERLRQRESDYLAALSTLRTWVVPLFALWILLRTLFDLDRGHLLVRAVGTGLVIAAAASGLSAAAATARHLSHRPRAEGRRPIPRLLLALPRLGIILLAAWFLLAGVWEVDLSAALTALGVTSLVISFALQDTLSGTASGFLLLADQPFKTGDWIQVDELLEGRVVDTSWRSTRIEDRNGDLVVVPNGNLAGAIITNFDEPARLHRVVVELQVAYRNPPTLAKEMLLDAARSTPGVLSEPAPEARVVTIDDPLMGYQVHLWIDDYAASPKVKSDFGSLVWYQSHRHNVPLPSPAQDLYLYDGAQTDAAERPDHGELRRRLQTSPLLDEIAEEDLDRFAAAASSARFARGETILVEGESRDVHVLCDGRARLVVRSPSMPDVGVVDLEVGDIFGVLDAGGHPGLRPVVVATTDCDVVAVRAGTAGTVISRTPQLADALEQLALTRRRRIDRLVRREGAAMAVDE